MVSKRYIANKCIFKNAYLRIFFISCCIIWSHPLFISLIFPCKVLGFCGETIECIYLTLKSFQSTKIMCQNLPCFGDHLGIFTVSKKSCSLHCLGQRSVLVNKCYWNPTMPICLSLFMQIWVVVIGPCGQQNPLYRIQSLQMPRLDFCLTSIPMMWISQISYFRKIK